jgi:hypothetical protein
MTPSRSAAIAATCGTPPESTASRSTLSMDALIDDLPYAVDNVVVPLAITPRVGLRLILV